MQLNGGATMSNCSLLPADIAIRDDNLFVLVRKFSTYRQGRRLAASVGASGTAQGAWV